MEKRIKIAGAGLSGLTAAINLLRAGCKVTVYEQGEEVGLRHKNGFQVIVNWRTDNDVLEVLKEMGIKINFLASPIKQGFLFGSGLKNKTDFKSNEPIFYLVRRGPKESCLDFSLKQQFLQEGGEIEFNTKADLERVDIVATGPKNVKLFNVGYNFETDFQDIACEAVDRDLAPKAFAYLWIRDGQGTIAAVLSENFKEKEEYLEKTVSSFKRELGLKMRNREKIEGFSDFFLAKTAIRNGRLYVGEAAGFQDSFVGAGMFFAMRSGYLAAKSIMEEADYDRLWKSELSDLLKASIVNRFLFETVGHRIFGIVMGLIGKHQGNLLELIKKAYRFDWKMKAIYPVARLSMRKRVRRK